MTKQKKGTRLVWLVAAVLVFAAGFVVATLFDLPISQELYSSRNGFAIFMEAFGWYPIFIPALLFFALLAARKNTPLFPVFRIAGILAYTLGFAAVYYNSYVYLVDRRVLAPVLGWKLIVFLIAGLALYVTLLDTAFHIPEKRRAGLEFFATWGTVFLITEQVAINLLKSLWQRSRFDEMLMSDRLYEFTPWYQPFANGGSSFPSGHTASAAAVLLLIVLCDAFDTKESKRKLSYVIGWVYIAAMALSRIIIGRHFLSDTLAGAGLMALILFGMRRTAIYKDELARLPKSTFPWVMFDKAAKRKAKKAASASLQKNEPTEAPLEVPAETPAETPTVVSTYSEPASSEPPEQL